MDWFTPKRAHVSADIRNLHPTAESILSVGIAYWSGPSEKPDDGVPRGRISRYAWGRDYHRVIKRRMKALHARLEESFGHKVEARFLVDTARVVERAVAARAGLGWYGKHSCECFCCLSWGLVPSRHHQYRRRRYLCQSPSHQYHRLRHLWICRRRHPTGRTPTRCRPTTLVPPRLSPATPRSMAETALSLRRILAHSRVAGCQSPGRIALCHPAPVSRKPAQPCGRAPLVSHAGANWLFPTPMRVGLPGVIDPRTPTTPRPWLSPALWRVLP
ncbi:MAG: DUF1730 domain-containing protein [Chloroflexota bacterium]|nr:DUF1730 domain-containing protein [Chloroflexota bacterium]